MCTGDSIRALQHAPEFDVGEVLRGASGTLLEASIVSAAGGLVVVVLCSLDPFLWPSQLNHRSPVHELLSVHHPLCRLHHRLLVPNRA